MKRNGNWTLWWGFGVALLAALSYIPFFSRFPVTRDFPWANLLLFAFAGCLLGLGLYRAFRQPARYRGKIGGSILAALSLGICGLFCFGAFYAARNIPSGETALRVGQQAPDFTLNDTAGLPVTLSQLRQGRRAVLLIFYRGYWWPLCNSELRSFERNTSEFVERGTKVVAISVDSPEESRRLKQSQGYTFPILSDPGAKTIRAYGVLHEHGAEDGHDIARPAEFLVDGSGAIRWVNLSESILARLRPEAALHVIDGLR